MQNTILSFKVKKKRSGRRCISYNTRVPEILGDHIFFPLSEISKFSTMSKWNLFDKDKSTIRKDKKKLSHLAFFL